MKFHYQQEIAAPLERVWEVLTDVPRAAQAIPGVEAVVPVGDGSYQGSMQVKLGPVRLNIQGKVWMEVRSGAQHQMVLHLEGGDRKIGGSVKSTIAVELASSRDGVSQLTMEADVNFMGRLGQFGQPLIKRKADTMLAEFTHTLATQVGDEAPAPRE